MNHQWLVPLKYELFLRIVKLLKKKIIRLFLPLFLKRLIS